MRFRNLTTTGDWTFGRGRDSYAANELALELNIKTRILSWVGNCSFDLQAGIDWKTRLDKGQRDNLLNDLRAIILQSEGVVGINSVAYNLDARRNLNVTYDIQTVYSSSFQRTVQQSVGATPS